VKTPLKVIAAIRRPGPWRHALGVWLVLDRDGDDVLVIPDQLTGDVGDERQVSAEMFGDDSTGTYLIRVATAQ
jgi:hypothetical protein